LNIHDELERRGVPRAQIEQMHGMRPRPERPERRRPQRRGPGGSRKPNASAGNAQRNCDRYVALAREAALKGDPIEAENFYQHAEHYFRVLRGQ
jgi:hypothetical protein